MDNQRMRRTMMMTLNLRGPKQCLRQSPYESRCGEHRQKGHDENPARHAKHSAERTSRHRNCEQPQAEATSHFSADSAFRSRSTR